MNITISNKLYLTGFDQGFYKHLENRLTFKNPKWIENENQGRWQGETPEYLKAYEYSDNCFIAPRGYIRQVISACRKNGNSFQIEDNRRALSEVDFQFTGTLKPYQQQAVFDMLSHDFGTLAAPTGSGKTVMALYLIFARRQPALIVVHTKELLNQWINRIERFLGIPREEIGIIGAGKKEVGEKITVATVQTLYKNPDVSKHIGYLVVDESHRCPSRTFTEAVTAFDSKYMLSMSATPYRKDGLSRLIYWYTGDCHHSVDRDMLIETGDILKPTVHWRKTGYTTNINASEHYSKMLTELTQDPERNSFIADDIAGAYKNDGVLLVLSDRKSHCEDIRATLLINHGIDADVLTGDLSKTKSLDLVERLNAGKVKVLCATGQLIGEGFDCPALTTLFLATPVKFSGRLLQYVGRVLRPEPGKEKAIVYDYVDDIGVLEASAKSRQRVYNA